MSKLSDNYPVGMSICDSNGISGNCGRDCPGYKSGDCPCISDINSDWIACLQKLIHKIKSQQSDKIDNA